MAHENLKPQLVSDAGKKFVIGLTSRIYENKVVNIYRKTGNYDFINYRFFEEVTVREYTGKKTRFGEDNPDHYRFDAVFFVEPGYNALNQRHIYSIGVELKGEKYDLLNDDKMEHYLGYTDFFFIGVPIDLVSDAINRAEGNDYIGVFCVDDGKIWLMPSRQEPSEKNQRDILAQILFTNMFNEDFKNSVSIKLEDVEILPMPFRENIKREMVQTTPAPESQEENHTGGEHQAQITQSENQYSENTQHLPYEGRRTPATASVDELSDEEREALDIAAYEAFKEEQKEKEMQRRQKHDAKVNAIKQELATMNAEVPSVVASMLEGLSLGDQRIYHVIRKNGGIQAQSIADMLPEQEDVEKPSLATVKRSISALTDAGLIEREGSKKTGQYIVKAVDCDNSSCQVCAKSPLCRQFQEVGK